jgi:alkylation response protein AidB-like acyl-CoA dehydrogenase
VDFTLSNDHVALRDVAQSFLDAEVNLAPLLVPGSKPDQDGYDGLWTKIAELGWPSLIIPEAYGGLGMGYIDLVMIVGEMGRTLAPAPFVGTLAGTWAILKAGSDEQKLQLLSRVVAGERKLALAVADENGNYPGSAVIAIRDGIGYRLSGAKWYAVDAISADLVVVSAMLDGAVKFFVVDRHAEGVEAVQLEWRDITRQVCTVHLEDAAGELLANSDDQVIAPACRTGGSSSPR